MIERMHLSIIQALHEYQTLTRAAQYLRLSQSALSHTMRKLEQELETELWKKEGRRLRLTKAGEHLLKVSRRVLPLLEHGEQTIREYGKGKRGKLRIGMECHPCYEWLMGVVSPFLQRWPDVDLDVAQRFQFNGIEALIRHQIDMTITSDPVNHKAVRFEPVADYELQLIVGETHPLYNKEYVTPADLNTHHLITYPVQRDRLDVFTKFLIPASEDPRSHQLVEATEIIFQLVAAGRGVCPLPDWMVQKYQNSYPIKGIRLGKKGVFKKLYVAFRKDDIEVDYIKSFVELSTSKEMI